MGVLGVRLPLSLRDICWHMVEEELQRRREMNALLWQMDVDPPIARCEEWVEARGNRAEEK